MTIAKTFRATINGAYVGNADPAYFDTLALAAGVTVQASHFEQIVFAGDDDVTVLAGSDLGKLTIKGVADSANNSLHFAAAGNNVLAIEGKNGLPPDYTHLTITGVVGSSIQLDRPAAVPAQFSTDGTINVSGSVLAATVGLNALAGDAAFTLTGNVNYIVHDQAAYTVNAHGDILVTENGHTIELDHFQAQPWHLTDAAGATFTYAQLVGAIDAQPGDVLIG